MKNILITTKLRNGIKDVQGDAILQSVGHDSKITRISVGQSFYLEMEDDASVEDLAKIFVNNLLYDYTIRDIEQTGLDANAK